MIEAYLGGESRSISREPREPPPAARSPLLELARLEVAYGGIQAVKGIDLAVDEGELVCLIGANGAGKTTTLKGICGVQPVEGRHASATTARTSPASRRIGWCAAGLAMVPEGRGVFGALTIEENLAMGAYVRQRPRGVRHDIEHVLRAVPAAARSAAGRPPARCPAASSRCWPSAGR